MANFIVWGSGTLGDFIRRLGSYDHALLQRALEFSSSLNRQIISALRPSLIVIPFSLSRNKALSGHLPTAFTSGLNPDIAKFRVTLSRRNFFFYIERSAQFENCRILHIPHPSSLRISDLEWLQVKRTLQRSVGKLT